MTIDYRGLRLIELTLEAVDRRDHYTDMSGTYFVHDREVSRLMDGLRMWVGDRFGIVDVERAFEKANELLALFLIDDEDKD